MAQHPFHGPDRPALSRAAGHVSTAVDHQTTGLFKPLSAPRRAFGRALAGNDHRAPQMMRFLALDPQSGAGAAGV